MRIDPADTYVKHEHKRGCDGDLYRLRDTVHIDRAGRVGNGGWVAHVYVCNRSWDGCKARVIVTECAVHAIADGALTGLHASSGVD